MELFYMKFIKQNSIYILIIFVILSVYADITTHNDVKTKNLCNAFHDETSRYTIVSYEVKDGDSVLSVMEDINKHKLDRKSTRLNSSHVAISYAVFCLKKKINNKKYNDR